MVDTQVHRTPSPWSRSSEVPWTGWLHQHRSLPEGVAGDPMFGLAYKEQLIWYMAGSVHWCMTDIPVQPGNEIVRLAWNIDLVEQQQNRKKVWSPHGAKMR